LQWLNKVSATRLVRQYSAADCHRVLNDAQLFATARKHGLTVLTRNLRDFDPLQQLEPSCAVLFYS
jgi:predicted nucleic acid-binding protein